MTSESTNPAPFQAKSAGQLILVVEEDPSFAVALKPQIEHIGFQVSVLDRPEDTFTQAKSRQPYLILMNAALESADALKLCREIKSNSYTSSIPLVLLSTVQTDEDSQLQGFMAGADDYLVKPVSDELFESKLRAVLRRYSTQAETPGSLQVEGLLLDLRSRKLQVNGNVVAVTRKEFDLLAAFLRRRNQVVYTSYLYHTVWGYGESVPVDSHTVKVHVSSLRSKLGTEIGRKIVNLPGLGYRFDT